MSQAIDFNATHALPEWFQSPGYATEVTVGFDGAEGGAVWISDDEGDQSIAVRGPHAMRELARLLTAFADGYTGPLEADK